MALPKVLEDAKNLKELMQLIEDLEDPNYLAQKGILLEEAPEIIGLLKQEIPKYADQINSYIEWLLKKRMEKQILSNGIADQMRILAARKSDEDSSIARDDKWIDIVCRSAGIEKLKTPVGEITYSGGEKMKIEKEGIELLPDELKKYVLSVEIAEKDKEAIIKLGYTPETTHIGLTDVKKWYKAKIASIDADIATIDTMRVLGETPEEKLAYDKQREDLLAKKKQIESKMWIDNSKEIKVK